MRLMIQLQIPSCDSTSAMDFQAKDVECLREAAKTYCTWPNGRPLRLRGRLSHERYTATILGGCEFDLGSIFVECNCASCVRKPALVGHDIKEDESSIMSLLEFAIHCGVVEQLEQRLHDNAAALMGPDMDMAEAARWLLPDALYVLDVPYNDGLHDEISHGVLTLSAFLQQSAEAAGGAALVGRRVGVFVFACPIDPLDAGGRAAVSGGSRGTAASRLLFTGRLVGYDASTGRHNIKYDPGQPLEIWRGDEDEQEQGADGGGGDSWIHVALCHLHLDLDPIPNSYLVGTAGGSTVTEALSRRGLCGPFHGCLKAVPSHWGSQSPLRCRLPPPMPTATAATASSEAAAFENSRGKVRQMSASGPSPAIVTEVDKLAAAMAATVVSEGAVAAAPSGHGKGAGMEGVVATDAAVAVAAAAGFASTAAAHAKQGGAKGTHAAAAAAARAAAAHAEAESLMEEFTEDRMPGCTPRGRTRSETPSDDIVEEFDADAIEELQRTLRLVENGAGAAPLPPPANVSLGLDVTECAVASTSAGRGAPLPTEMALAREVTAPAVALTPPPPTAVADAEAYNLGAVVTSASGELLAAATEAEADRQGALTECDLLAMLERAEAPPPTPPPPKPPGASHPQLHPPLSYPCTHNYNIQQQLQDETQLHPRPQLQSGAHHDGGGMRLEGGATEHCGLGPAVAGEPEIDLGLGEAELWELAPTGEFDPGLAEADPESDAEALVLCAAIEQLHSVVLRLRLPNPQRHRLLLSAWTMQSWQVRRLTEDLVASEQCMVEQSAEPGVAGPASKVVNGVLDTAARGVQR